MNKKSNFEGGKANAALEHAARRAGVNTDALKQAVNSGNLEEFAKQNLDSKTAQSLQKIDRKSVV